MNKAFGRKPMIAAVAVALVLALVVVIIMPRISSKKAVGENSATMENVDPSDYIAEPVDLGLSVKWANFNIGASRPEEYGGLYG